MGNSFNNTQIRPHDGEKKTSETPHESKHFEDTWSWEKLFGGL